MLECDEAFGVLMSDAVICHCCNIQLGTGRRIRHKFSQYSLAKEALLVGSDNDLMRVDNKHEQTTIASMKLDATFGGGADQNLIRWRGSFFAAV